MSQYFVSNRPLVLLQGSVSPNTMFNKLFPSKNNQFKAMDATTYYVTLALVDRNTGADVFGVDLIVDAVTPFNVVDYVE